jgi:hypothetical protein
MGDLVTIAQLSALVEDQYRLLGWLEDNGDGIPAYDPVFEERNIVEARIGGEPWSITVQRAGLECCQRDAGRTVLLERDHPSPFDFRPLQLLRFVQSVDADTRITDIVIDNWILKLVRAGRLAPSRHRSGYFTFA